MMELDWLIANSDPANIGLLAVMWWRIDRRLKRLSRQQEEIADADHSEKN